MQSILFLYIHAWKKGCIAEILPHGTVYGSVFSMFGGGVSWWSGKDSHCATPCNGKHREIVQSPSRKREVFLHFFQLILLNCLTVKEKKWSKKKKHLPRNKGPKKAWPVWEEILPFHLHAAAGGKFPASSKYDSDVWLSDMIFVHTLIGQQRRFLRCNKKYTTTGWQNHLFN